MDAAKAAISKFTSNKGQHTTVDENVQPAITQETVKPHRHEETTQAIDKEVHQDHYHTTVQPLSHKEVLPEKHTHNVVPTENREYRHENQEATQQKVSADLSRFTDSSRTEQTRHTTGAAPTVTGEHIHHHVHENVVPVIHKETIQPEVVHTTVPVHETHHAAAQHHGLSALPMKTLDEFSRSGGKLTGGSHGTNEEYDGAPRQYNDKLSTTFEKLGLAGSGATTGSKGVGSHRPTDTGVSGVGGSSATGVGHQHRDGNGAAVAGAGAVAAGSGVATAAHHRRRGSASSYSSSSEESVGGTRRKKDRIGRRAVGSGGATGAGAPGIAGAGTTGSNTGNTRKPGLMDKLNPRVDADGDGKAGFAD